MVSFDLSLSLSLIRRAHFLRDQSTELILKICHRVSRASSGAFDDDEFPTLVACDGRDTIDPAAAQRNKSRILCAS